MKNWLSRMTVLIAALLPATAVAQQVRITTHIFTGASTNHGQLDSAWQPNSGVTLSNTQAREGLVFHKANDSADLGIPYANVEGAQGAALRELGFDVSSQKKNHFSGGHCNASPTIEVTLTNGTTYAFYCNKGIHQPIQHTAWDRVRFRDADATPISCHDKGCTLEPWPGFSSGKAIIAAPKDDDPKSSTFQIIMMDGYDSAPDFSGLSFVDNIDLNGTLIGDQRSHSLKCRVRGCTPPDSDIQARGGIHAHS